MYYNWKYSIGKFKFELAKTINNNIINITVNRKPVNVITVIGPLDTKEKFEDECNKWMMEKCL